MARKGPFKDLAWGRLDKGKTSKTKAQRSNASHLRTGLMSQLKQVAADAATPKNKPTGPMKGIVLHVYKEDPAAAAGSSWMTTWYDEILGVPLPETVKMKVRIPTLHAGIPEPEEYGCGSDAGEHWFWINMHPTFYASSQDIEMPECGDAVIVSVSSPSDAGHDGGGIVLSTVVTRENNPIKKGVGCPPSEAFPDATASTAEGADGDAIGGEEVSALPVNPFSLPADCDFDCMVDFMSSISTLPQLAPGRNPDGSLNPIASPFDKKGIFINRNSLSDKNLPTPLMALIRALWADLGYVVFECIEQTATRTYKTDRDLLNIYARMFSLGGLQVYVSGTPYPGQASKFVEYMTDTVVDIGAKGMVISPSWGYLSPGNKNKYARQARYLTNAMMRAARAAHVQLGFTNPWLPSAEYTVAEVDGEEGSVSIRYKDSFPYSCFTGVDWSICQILSRNGRSEVEINESTGEVTLVSLFGSNAMTRDDFVQALADYANLGFKNIVPAFGIMGHGYEDYRVSSEKPPGRMREELEFLAAIQVPSLIGEVATSEQDPSYLPQPGMIQTAMTVPDWSTGYFGTEIPCADGDPDVRCLPPPESPFETLEEIIDTASTAADVLEDVTGMDEFGDIGDALDVAAAAVDKAKEVTSKIWPTFPPEDPIIKYRVVNSVMWWDWLNAEKHTPCWKSTRWEIIKHFHRYSPIAMARAMEGGSDEDSKFDVLTKRIQNAIAAIEAYNRIAEQNPSMMKTSLEAYLLAVESAPVATTFAGNAAMEAFAQAASAVAQSSGTEMGYDGEGSASGGGTDADDLIDAATDYADSDAYYGSDHEEYGESSREGEDSWQDDQQSSPPPEYGESSREGEDLYPDDPQDQQSFGSGDPTDEGSQISLSAYPPFPYIKLDAPVQGGDVGGWRPATAFTEQNRTPATINFIVIHATDGPSQEAGGESFCKPGAEKSTNYGINTGGWVYMFVKEKDIANGSGGSTTHGDPPSAQGNRRQFSGGHDKLLPNMNSNGISIEITGRPNEEANQPGKWYTEETYSNLALLVANICHRNQISIDRSHIFGHDEMTLRRSDPGTILQTPYPAGISYPYGGIDKSGTNQGPKGGEMPDGWRFRINSYSPNIAGKGTFDWVRFMGLVEGFFNGSGTALPPNSSFPAGLVGATGGGATAPPAAGGCSGGAGAAAGTIPPDGTPLSAAQIAQLGQFQGVWPSGGSQAISSDFGWRGRPPMAGGGGGTSNHRGIDIISWENPGSHKNPGVVPIFSIAPGTVTKQGNEWMDIDHGGGFSSQYGHMDSYTVSNGEQVTKGQIVGMMGTKTFNVTSTGVHLHFQATINGKQVDPQSKFGLECNARAKSSTIYGHLCAPGNQNQEPRGALAGFGKA